MFRRLLPLLGLLLLASLSVQAQDKVELFGGYSYMRIHNSPSANLNGWEIAGQYEFTGHSKSHDEFAINNPGFACSDRAWSGAKASQQVEMELIALMKYNLYLRDLSVLPHA